MKEQIMAVQRMQEYIGEHLEEEITLTELANVSCFSPWHSYRLFREYTNLMPSDYIRRLRLSKSAIKLRSGDVKVIDAAYDLGFGSVDGYQRAFYREFGCNPGEYANTSTYVQGVEASMDYDGIVPDGFDVIELPHTIYLVFQGEPFKEEEYCEAIVAVQHAMGKYDPTVIGYEWDDGNPCIQLEPRGERGYIELRAVKKLSVSNG